MVRLNWPRSIDPSVDDRPFDNGDIGETAGEDSTEVNEEDADRDSTATNDCEPDDGSSPGDCESVGQTEVSAVPILPAILAPTALLGRWSR